MQGGGNLERPAYVEADGRSRIACAGKVYRSRQPQMIEQLNADARDRHENERRVLGSKGHQFGRIIVLRVINFLPHVENETCAGTDTYEGVDLLSGKELEVRKCQKGAVMLISGIRDLVFSFASSDRAILIVELCSDVKMIPEVVAPLNISITFIWHANAIIRNFQEERGITHTNLEFVSGILSEHADSS